MKIKSTVMLMLMLVMTLFLVGVMAPEADALELDLSTDIVVSVADISNVVGDHLEPAPVSFFHKENEKSYQAHAWPVRMERHKMSRVKHLSLDVLPSTATYLLHLPRKFLRL